MSLINRHVFEIENVRRDYISLVEFVAGYGKPVSPRGVETYELECFTVIHHRPAHCVVHDINRKANLKIAAAEALQLVGGFSDPQRMAEIQPNFRQFMDGGAFYGAYGPRIRHQMQRVIDKLEQDPSTRQARVTIWRDSDLFAETKDPPCTLGFTFHIRDKKLSMHTHMRSNDVWWGFTYDITQFCFLQLCVAEALWLDVGPYYHHIDSFHLYARDEAQAEQLFEIKGVEDRQLIGLGSLGTDKWAGIQSRALRAFNNDWPHEITEMLHG